ncbi:MaoC family dehydratase [Pedobacter sandarakinus]|uniref:MaoC family dehydratase n=1 Tax=Pedobacter sandarakinus TaxID=353156 RepID=UPI00224750E3|nr:MaoC family dehydratase [Pedobacter sandarakinus]MCX2575034.1 MaoC family dehydratase [Pedobacter sandarakinus]
MQIITSHAAFEEYLGKELGVSSWHTVTQDQINKFAAATLDFQWIHTDEEKAKNEGPFGTTIAHGYLTLSLIPFLWKEIVDIQNLKMEINYGIESLKFAQPVTVNSKIRLRAKLASIVNLRGVTKVHMGIEMEIEDQKKPAFTGEVVFLYHFITA